MTLRSMIHGGTPSRRVDPAVAAGVEAAVKAAQAHAARAAARLKTQSHCWAALSTGDTRQILDAVRLLRPSAFDSIRSFIATASAADPRVHARMHSLLDAEAEAVTSDARQFERVRDALEKLVTTRLYPTVFGLGEGDESAESEFEANLAIARDTLTHDRLGVSPVFCDGGAWTASSVMLQRISRYRAPADKLALIVNACRLIERRLHTLGVAEKKASIAERKRAGATQRRQARELQIRQAQELQIWRGREIQIRQDLELLKRDDQSFDSQRATDEVAVHAFTADEAAMHSFKRLHVVEAIPKAIPKASLAPAASEEGGDMGSEDADEKASEAGDVTVGADEFFPVLVWVVLHCTPTHICSELSFISRFRHPDKLRGVSGCYFTHVRAAVKFIEMTARGTEPETARGTEPETARRLLGATDSARSTQRHDHLPSDKEEEGHLGSGRYASAAQAPAQPSALRTAAGRWADWLIGGSPAIADEPRVPSTRRNDDDGGLNDEWRGQSSPRMPSVAHDHRSSMEEMQLGRRDSLVEEEEVSAAQSLGFY